MKSALQYLKDNNLGVCTGLAFTCNDYYFIVDNKYDSIIINQNKGVLREEILSKKDIVNRIHELYVLYKKDSVLNTVKADEVIKILKENKPELFRKEKIGKLLIDDV